jgi:hypothetical protein
LLPNGESFYLKHFLAKDLSFLLAHLKLEATIVIIALGLTPHSLGLQGLVEVMQSLTQF